MEAREDSERGADTANTDTFGNEVCSWSFEEQLAANQRLSECERSTVSALSGAEQKAPHVDPAWREIASCLGAEHMRFVTMESWSGSGLFWGKCACCKTWINGPEHFTSKNHVKRAVWWTGEDDHAPADNRSTETAASGRTHTTKARGANVEVYYPTGFTGSDVDGAFLVDSFYYLVEVLKGDSKEKKKTKTKKVYYVPDLLAELWRDTGLVFIAVCSGLHGRLRITMTAQQSF